MSRRNRVPSYRLHKQSGQAVVTLSDGLGRRRDLLLGAFDSPASRTAYARVIGEWEVANRQLPPEKSELLSVNEVLLRYHEFAEGYYQKNGQPTSQLDRVRRSLRFVKNLYGLSPATEFGAVPQGRACANGRGRLGAATCQPVHRLRQALLQVGGK